MAMWLHGQFNETTLLPCVRDYKLLNAFRRNVKTYFFLPAFSPSPPAT